MAQLLQIETYDQVFIREGRQVREVDARITTDGRIIIKRGLDSETFADVRAQVYEHTGQLIAPVLAGDQYEL